MTDTRAHPYAGLARQLEGTTFAGIVYVEETGSTNADAAALLGDENSGGRTIVAEHQTQGAGRKGRSWKARPGTALLFTTILPVALDADELWGVPFWVALAVRRALKTHGIDAMLHWPNDLLADDRKIAGILCTSRVTGDKARAACGVGINVHRLPGAGAEIDPPPAFCDEFSGSIDRAALLRAVLREYEATLDLLRLPSVVAGLWEADAGLPGVRYRILKDGESTPFEATAQRLSDRGGLVIAHDDGTRETISLADARVLRPAPSR